MKRIVSLMLAVVLCLSMVAPASAAPVIPLTDSGVAGTVKLTKYEIRDLLYRTEFNLNAGIWATIPKLDSPYEVGSVAQDLQNKATVRLNALRTLAGLPEVTLDSRMSIAAQYSAFVQALNGGLNHYPTQPKGLPDDIYAKGYEASGSCNLSGGHNYEKAVDALMDDSASKNVATVGHRRWQLNPLLGKVGFGYVENNRTSLKRYVSEYIVDMSAERPAYNFIAWPASGNFPNNTAGFKYNTPWSIHLNSEVYETPRARDIKVKLIRVADNMSWEFDGKNNYSTSDYGTYFNVDTGGYGDGYAIIFRPSNIYTYNGLYEVQVTGLRSISGHDVSLRYQVDFFNPTSLGEPTAPIKPLPPTTVVPSGFTDVPRSHWAYNYIMYAAGDGAVNGVGNGLYKPDNDVTGYEFAAIILRGLFPEVLSSTGTNGPWHYQIDFAADKMGLWYGVDGLQKDQPLTRYQMAVMIYNALSSMGVARKTATQHPEVYATIKDWDIVSSAYEDAVVTCLYYKLLQGVGDNRFNGTSNVTRAQAATVYCRLRTLPS